jgi:hypothetical protein
VKVTLSKQSATGEVITAEAEGSSYDDISILEMFKTVDQRMLDMNNRIIVATEIERRHGPEVAMAVREVMDTIFGNRPMTQEMIQDAYRQRAEADQRAITESRERRGGKRG